MTSRVCARGLPYLRDLGVDAIWVTPWYVSPLADGGYDVADYRAIDPAFGTLAEAERLIDEALALGIRTIIDVVPNHVSDQHAWFQAALAAGPGSPERARFWFHPGKGENGDEIPTHWVSDFQGSTWTRTTNPDGTPGEWYLHLFAPEQPDVNWSHPEVVAEFEDVLRFWFDRGVAGIRIDSAALLIKDPTLPEVPEHPGPGEHPHVDRDELHDVYRGWRAVADSYDGKRVLVGEVWLQDTARFAQYLRPDEMHTAFNFDFMARPWDAKKLRESIDLTLAAHGPVGAPATWVLSNHDVTRPVTRYGREDSSFAFTRQAVRHPDRPRRSACAAPVPPRCSPRRCPAPCTSTRATSSACPRSRTCRSTLLQDPMHFRSEGVDPGRDGCRVPLPWSGTSAPFGFSPAARRRRPCSLAPAARRLERAHGRGAGGRPRVDAAPLPRPARAPSVRARPGRRSADAGSTSSTRSDDVLAFARGDLVCVVNLGDEPAPLPAHTDVLLTSAPLEAGLLPRDTAAWLRTARP